MNEMQYQIVIGGLLHDIGKVVYRSGDGRSHPESGCEFLQDAGIHPGLSVERLSAGKTGSGQGRKVIPGTGQFHDAYNGCVPRAGEAG